MVLIEYLNWPYQYFKHPYAILFIIPIIIALRMFVRSEFFKMKKGEVTEKWLKRRNKLRRIINLITPVIFLMLLIALASPFTERETLIQGEAYLRILFDNSTSFSLFDPDAGYQLRDELSSQIRVEARTVSGSDKTPLGDEILSTLQNEGNVLLVSDGQNNFGADLGDVALYAQKLNATINALVVDPIHSDASVEIIGPSKTLEEIENKFYVKINKVGEFGETVVNIKVDGQDVFSGMTSEEEIEIAQTFSGGYHTITAEIVAENDYFPQNNIFYKTVKVVKKPKVLFITVEKSPLEDLLRQIYEVTASPSLPDDLGQYSAVVINDLNSQQVGDDEVDQLIDYISDGNGLMVVGGRNSFEYGKYKDSRFEQLLPVFVSSPGKEEGDMNIVMVLDISGSTGQSFGDDTTVDVEKAQAVSVLSDLKPENKLGVVAFNSKAFVIDEMSYIFEKIGLVEKIAKLKDGGGTLISVGLFQALEMLKPTEGSKNIILISDGVTQLMTEAEQTALLAEKMGVKIYTVSVGERTNDHVMGKLAAMTNGIFFKAQQSHRLRILFGDPEQGDRDRFGVTVLNSNHFITENLDIRAVITGYNQVVPKATANLLITTDIGDPLLTVWRFGLGRIAALTTDDGRMYAGSLLGRNTSVMLTRTMNWAIGDPDRKSETYVDISDTRLNEPTPILVKSETPPKAEDVVFFRVDDDLYRANIVPEDKGFHQIIDATFAVNSKREYGKVGLNLELEEIVASTGGKMYTVDQAEQIIDEVKSRSKRSVVKKVYIRWPFILAAIVLYLLQIYLRRVTKNKKAYK